jgi:8-oxo-dGTP diphosphatase
VADAGPIHTERQESAGGVAYRRAGDRVEVALISTGDPPRWQLPKGLVDPGETPERAALRETREEAGVETDLVTHIETVEYWYQSYRHGRRVRYQKFVHFYLLAYRAGDVADHDDEVHEARWFPVDEALELLAFPNERRVLEQARDMTAA